MSEMKKPSLAVAFNVQRKNKKSKGGLIRGDAGKATADTMQYAEGGVVRAGSERPTADSGQTHVCADACYMTGGHKNAMVRADAGMPTADSMQETFADGGMAGEEMPVSEEYRAGQKSVYDALRHKARFAKGGRVDDQDDSDTEHGNYEDDLSFEALGKKLYDTDQLDEQPSDSNEKGDSREKDDEDDEDSSILGKIKKRGKTKAE